MGEIPWGSHFCNFYETKQDLLDTLIPYFKTGLESNEFCFLGSLKFGLITVEEAKKALEQVVPDFERHFSDKNIEILNETDWYLEDNVFNLEKVINAWHVKAQPGIEKLRSMMECGFQGIRSGEREGLERFFPPRKTN